MNKSDRFSPEVRERTVRVVLEHRGEYPSLWDRAEDWLRVTGTAQPKMNQAKMNGIPIAMPPKGEQHRIVAKVDELMALSDRLKADLTRACQHQAILADTLIESALEPT